MTSSYNISEAFKLNEPEFIHSVAVNSLSMYFVLDTVLGSGNRVVYKAKKKISSSWSFCLCVCACERERIKINVCKIYTMLDNINM